MSDSEPVNERRERSEAERPIKKTLTICQNQLIKELPKQTKLKEAKKMRCKAYANPETLQFGDKIMYRQSLTIMLDGIPVRFYRYTDSLAKCLAPAEYDITSRVQVRADKLVLRPEFVTVKP